MVRQGQAGGTPSSCHQHNRGFTLLEVLVVLVIIGVLTGLASLSLEYVLGRSARDEVERLRRVLELASDRASVQGSVMKVEFLPHGYRFSAFEGSEWQMLFAPPEFAERSWPEDLAPATLEIEGKPIKAPMNIVFGSESPEFRFTLQHGPERWTLQGRITGEVQLDMQPAAPIAQSVQ